MTEKFHTAVVGSGSGGLTVALGLSKLGKKVALIEKHHVGGDCTNFGCVPSKALIHASYKVAAGSMTAKDALAHVRERRDHLRDEETEWVEDLENVTFVKGYARFKDSNTLQISDDDGSTSSISAKNIVLSTGGRPRVFDIEGLGDEHLLTNESIFELEELPTHLVIIGGGVIGLEMAFCFRRLGSQVTLLDLAERLLMVSEPQVSELLETRLQEEGVEVCCGATVQSFDSTSQEATLSDGRVLKGVDKVLMAAGRIPNLDLDLDNAGVTTDRRGVPTDGLGQTNVGNIYAIGDINHRSAFTHSANHQGRRLVKKLAFPFLPSPSAEPHYPSAVFSSPEIAQVGPTLIQLQEKYHAELIVTNQFDLKDTDRGYTMGLEHGFVIIHSLALTGKVLSATIAAPSAGEMISVFTLAVNNNISMYKLAELVFPYPVLSDAIKKAANAYVFGTLGKLPKEILRFVKHRWT